MRKTIRAIISIALALVLLLALQRLVMPKYTGEITEGGYVREYYREKNPHQVILIGDCEVYENFSTIRMWRDHGITSYIRGSAQQLAWQSYYLLRDTLRYETPEVVVFNVLSLKYDEPQSEEYNRMTLDGMRWSADKLGAIRVSMLPEEYTVDYLFPILRYHSRVTQLSKDDLSYYFKDMQRTTAGYYMRVDTYPYEPGVWGEDEDVTDEPLGSHALSYLDRIRTLCEEKGIRLLLVKAPSVYPVWQEQWEEEIRAYAQEYGLDYINYLKLTDELGIDFETDTYDQGLHMNLSGAEKCAGYLGDFLAEEYGLADQSGDPAIAADWAGKEAFFEEQKAEQEALLE